MKRREFITVLGGGAALTELLRPGAAIAQERRLKRLAILGTAENDLNERTLRAALIQELEKLGWAEDRNLHIDMRFGSDNSERTHEAAAELVGLLPDVIITTTQAIARIAQQKTKTIPIVFAMGGDPTVSGFIRNVARPEGNVTGFSSRESSIAGKWLELLKEAAPRINRVALIYLEKFFTQTVAAYLSTIEAAAPLLALHTTRMAVRDPNDIMRSIDAFAAEPRSGSLVVPPFPVGVNRETIIRLAVRHRLPAIYSTGTSIVDGGLMSYGPVSIDQYRRAATYVDRLLRGGKVSDLPVQFPTKFELVINLKTAKAIGLDIPPTLRARADEVIE